MASKFEDFVIGYRGSFSKAVTEEDNLAFAELSGDHNPIHFDDELARSFGLEGRISNGFVNESRIAGALVKTFGSPDTSVIALEKHTSFRKPVYMGDVVTANVEVVARSESKKLLRIEAESRNQHDELIANTQMLVKILERE